MEPILTPKVVTPVLPPVKADIEVRDKKSKKVAVKEKPSRKDEAKEKAAAKVRQEAELKELEAYSDRIRKNEQERLRAVQAQIRAEVSAANKTQIERYTDKIRSKIRSKMKAVADVPESAVAIFKITLLPDGTVMDVELQKSSGYPAFDNAVERAIRLADPLPMPTDVTLQMTFREFKLSYRP
jgi:colicin import membrane protein